jgi:hypothetical protein
MHQKTLFKKCHVTRWGWGGGGVMSPNVTWGRAGSKISQKSVKYQLNAP